MILTIYVNKDDAETNIQSKQSQLPDDRVQETRVAAIKALLIRPIIASPLYSHPAKTI